MTPHRFRLHLTLVATVLLCLPGLATANGKNPHDPWEGFNRAMFSFNEGLDRALIKPLAKGYEAVTPTPVNNIITNFFDNIDDLAIAANNLLQGKFRASASDLGRVIINSTLGIGGLIDVATGMTLEKHEEDFGQTLGHWGFGDGAYLVLPVFGSRTVRDSFGLLADLPMDPMTWVEPNGLSYSLIGARQLDARADLLPAEKVVEAGAIDKYGYLRDAYLQQRRYLIYDGQPPRDDEE